jgi:hypothetical protein
MKPSERHGFVNFLLIINNSGKRPNPQKLIFVELAHQKADEHFCVAFHKKVRIRLHPSRALGYGNDCFFSFIFTNLEQQVIKSAKFSLTLQLKLKVHIIATYKIKKYVLM